MLRSAALLILFIGPARESLAQGADVMLVGSGYVNGRSTLQKVDPSTGQATTIATLGTSISGGSDYRAGNGLLYSAGLSIYAVNPTTYDVQIIPPFPAVLPTGMFGVAFNATDQLFAVGGGFGSLYRLDPSTGGVLSSLMITGTQVQGEIKAIDFAPDGTLYGAGLGLYSINPATGAATRITPSGRNILTSSTAISDVDFGQDGVLRCTGTTGASLLPFVASIDTQTGIGSFIGAIGSAGYLATPLDGLASVPVPEPRGLISVCSMAATLAAVVVWRAALAHKTPANPRW